MIQPGQQHRQRRFTAAVAANQKDQLATLERQVQRAYREGVIFIVESHIAQFQRLPVRVRRRLRESFLIRRQREFIQFIERHLRAQQRGQRAHRRQQRRAQEQQRKRVCGGNVGVGPAETVRHPEHQTNGPQHHNIRPVDRTQMEGVSPYDMVAVVFRIRREFLFVDILRALAVQGQLFAPFQHRLVIVVQAVFGFTQRRHVFIHPRHQHETAPDGQRHPQGGNQQHFTRQHRQVGRGAHGQNNPLHQFWQSHESNGDRADVAGQPRQ